MQFKCCLLGLIHRLKYIIILFFPQVVKLLPELYLQGLLRAFGGSSR